MPPRIEVHTDFRLKEVVKMVPGARWDSDRRVWTVPLSWPSCLALRTEFGSDLNIGAGLAEWAKAVGPVKASLRAHRADIEVDARPNLPGFADLYPYQLVGARLIKLAQGYLLMDDTGTGKSRTALAGLALLPEPFPCLIVCPKSMIRTWGREIELFFPDANVSLVQGTPSKMVKALAPGADFYVINYESLRKYSRVAGFGDISLKDDEKTDKEIQAIGLRSVIADECHRAKNPRSIQTRALWAATTSCLYRIGLTGTPIQESPEDLWSILRLVAPYEYMGKTAYVDRYLDQSWNEWGGREINGLLPRTREEFLANFDARSRRITKEVALPFLPPKMEEIRWVTLPAKLRKVYTDMERKLVTELESGDKLTAANNMVKQGRLVQLANASGTVEITIETNPETGQDVEHVHLTLEPPSPKIDAFLDDVKAGDFEGRSVVVYCDSRQLIDLLAEQMDKARPAIPYVRITGDENADERQQSMDSFQAGEVPFILITRAGGTGITLTRADTMVRLVRPWSLIEFQQSEDRVHRIGSEIHESITYIDYLTEDTVEEGQFIRLNSKEANAQEVLRDDELLDVIKARIDK